MNDKEVITLLGDKCARAVFFEETERNRTSRCTIFFKASNVERGYMRWWFDIYENDAYFSIEILNMLICNLNGVRLCAYINPNYECYSIDNVLIVSKDGVFFTDSQQSLDASGEQDFEKKLENFERYVVEYTSELKQSLTKLDGTPQQIAQDLLEDFSRDKDKWAKFIATKSRSYKNKFLQALDIMAICLKENKTDAEQALIKAHINKAIE